MSSENASELSVPSPASSRVSKRRYREWTSAANAEVGKTASDILRAHHFSGLDWEGVPDRSFWLWSDASSVQAQPGEQPAFNTRIAHCWEVAIKKFETKGYQYYGQKPTASPYEHKHLRVLSYFLPILRLILWTNLDSRFEKLWALFEAI